MPLFLGFSSWRDHIYRWPLRAVLVLLLLPLALVLFAVHCLNLSLGQQQVLHNLSVTAALAAQTVEETLEETSLFERMLANQSGFRDAITRRDSAQLTRVLQESLQLAPNLSQAVVATPDGTLIALVPRNPELVGQSIAHDEGFLGAQQGGWHPYVSGVHLSEGAGQEKVVDVVLPISEDHAVIGVLMVQHEVGKLRLWLQKIRIEPEGFLYLVDHYNQLVAYPFQVLPGRPKVVSDWPPIAQTNPQIGGTLIFRGGRHQERWLAGVHPVSTTGWRVVAVQPERAVFRLLHRTLWPTGLLVGLLVVLFVNVTWQWLLLQRRRVFRRRGAVKQRRA